MNHKLCSFTKYQSWVCIRQISLRYHNRNSYSHPNRYNNVCIRYRSSIAAEQTRHNFTQQHKPASPVTQPLNTKPINNIIQSTTNVLNNHITPSSHNNTTASTVSLTELYTALTNTIPQSHVLWCCAYGSRIFQQSSNKQTSTTTSLIDIIIVVQNIQQFHQDNVRQNPTHYSRVMRLFGLNSICYMNKLGGNMYYNTDIVLNNSNIHVKYGIIELNDLITDLTQYTSIYVAGRLHKPVRILHNNIDNQFHNALQQNLYSAVNIALLLMSTQRRHPTALITGDATKMNTVATAKLSGNKPVTNDDMIIQFTLIELYCVISSISYQGDIRMNMRAENPNKVNNIVLNNTQHFHSLYEPIIHQFIDSRILLCTGDDNHTQLQLCCTDDIKYQLLVQLPLHVEEVLCEYDRAQRSGEKSNQQILHDLSYNTSDTVLYHSLQHTLRLIVQRSSTVQSVKGIATAGFVKAIRYAIAKIRNSIQK